MAFVNEYVSQEDIEKNKLIKLVDNYLKRDNRSFKDWMELDWCIDKQQNIWFIHTLHPHLNDHREGWTGEDFFVLHYQRKNIEIVLRRVSEESSVKIADNPFKVVWKLDRIKEEDLKGFDYQEIVDLLREILSVYGWKGARLEKHVTQKNLSVELRV